MTDNEIIKALELCGNRTIHSCKSCSCNGGVECNEKLNGGALDLINRQKAEIRTARTEVIKEFAEELKKRASKIYIACSGDYERITEYQFSPETIDNLVKEMTEGENGKL